MNGSSPLPVQVSELLRKRNPHGRGTACGTLTDRRSLLGIEWAAVGEIEFDEGERLLGVDVWCSGDPLPRSSTD
jgi:hypothetical protein